MSDYTEAQAAPTPTINHPDGKRARPPSSSSPLTTSLATFLQRDIHPQEGHRLLLPFLTTMDRLHLSECSQGLMDYRYHLSKVKVVNHPSPTPGNKRGLARLLLDQRQLECLRVVAESMLHVLDLASWGWFEGLKTLDLSCSEMYIEEEDEEPEEFLLDAKSVGYVTRALGGGGLRRLEELNLSECPLGDEGFKAVLDLLKAGVCPQLRRLQLDRNDLGGEECDAMAETLKSGHLHHLEELDLSWNGLGGGAAIARALQGGACPQLIKLRLLCCGLSREAGEALGEAMRSGSCVKLEDLDLGENPEIGDEAFMAIFGALEAGSCPSLERLNLNSVSLSAQSATALGHALRPGNCHHLQWLDIWKAFKDRDGSLHVLQAIQQGERGAIPNLLFLDMTDTHMDQEHGRVLGEAIGGGALPELEVLGIGGNESLGDVGVVPIMAGLEGGGCRHLKELGVGSVDMGPQGGHALARALASGHLNCLQDFSVLGNGGVGDEAMVEVVKGLRECHQLRWVNVERTGMGVMAGQALVQALQDKAWPDLERIEASNNKDLLSDEGVVVGLVGVLERSGELCPRLIVVHLRRTGLVQEGEAGRRLAVTLMGLGFWWALREWSG